MTHPDLAEFTSDQATGTACSGCGQCCELIPVSFDPRKLLPYVGVSDPRDDEAWARWRERDYRDEDRARWVDHWLNANFLFEHWTVVAEEAGRTFFTCDAWDPETRLCTAHDTRPPICSGFPWYGKTRDQLDELSSATLRSYPDGLPRCEFFADVPTAARPPGWKPVLLTTKPRED